MSILTRWVFFGAVSASLASGAGAATFSQLVVFGDSLSDAGNAAAITSNNFPPSPFPYAGPASNGPTAAQYLAQRYGATVELGWPSATASSNNYAVLGGLNGQGNYNVQIDRPADLGVNFPTMASTGISQQIAKYQSVNPSVPNAANTLFMVWGGPNDAFLAVESPGADLGSINQAMGQALTDLAGDIQQLAAMGAAHILVPNMPDLGLTPEALAAGPTAQYVLSSVSQGTTRAWPRCCPCWTRDWRRSAWSCIPSTRRHSLPTSPPTRPLTASPTPRRVASTRTHRLWTSQACKAVAPATCTSTGVHPTTAAHALLADAFAGAVPEPETWALMLVGLAAVALARRRGTPSA